MTIKNFLANLFKVEQPAEPKTTKTITNNSITFSIDGFHRTLLKINIDHTDEDSCHKFATMLYDIVNGNYEQAVLDSLVSLSKQRPELVPTIETILISWGMTISKSPNSEPSPIKTAQSDNRSFIRPRNVFLGSNK